MQDNPADGFDAVLAQYGDMVYRLAFAYVRSKADADDIFQEVFFRYFRRAPVLKTEEHRKAWLLRVTINRAKTCLARRILPHNRPETTDTVPFSAPEMLELHEALETLAPKYRTVLHLFYYEGYTAEEIGGLLRQKPATVRTQLTRARQKLAALLRDET